MTMPMTLWPRCKIGCLVNGCVFWPIANFINFSFISPGARLPYLATVGGLWNGYLSYINAKDWLDGQQQSVTFTYGIIVIGVWVLLPWHGIIVIEYGYWNLYWSQRQWQQLYFGMDILVIEMQKIEIEWVAEQLGGIFDIGSLSIGIDMKLMHGSVQSAIIMTKWSLLLL